ncbi:MAG: accessory gene regulator B family protein [Sarcina sp.]
MTNRILSFLEQELCLEDNVKEKIRYGLEVLIGEGIKLIIIFLISLYFGKGQEFFIVMGVFLLRIYIGGTHAKTYMGCLLRSIFNFLLIYFLGEVVPINLKGSIILILICISIIPSIQYKDKFNKPIKHKSNKRLNCELIFMILVGAGIVKIIVPENYNLLIITLIYIFCDYLILRIRKGRDNYVKNEEICS